MISLIGKMNGLGEQIEDDWRTHVLSFGLLFGLLIAYKWELFGGVIATAAIIISGFYHPVVMIPGILFIVLWLISHKGSIKKE
ncbi:MAG: hypothetical protein JXR19_03345 [Bacteroidia bacterium]